MCQQSGAELASITSAAEAAFIDSILYVLCLSLPRKAMFLPAFVCLFVCRITQRLLNRFSRNSVESWHTEQRCAGMAFNIPMPSHSHLFNSYSLPSPFPFFDLFPFLWDSRVGYSHSLPFLFPILCFIPIPMGFPVPLGIPFPCTSLTWSTEETIRFWW